MRSCSTAPIRKSAARRPRRPPRHAPCRDFRDRRGLAAAGRADEHLGAGILAIGSGEVRQSRASAKTCRRCTTADVGTPATSTAWSSAAAARRAAAPRQRSRAPCPSSAVGFPMVARPICAAGGVISTARPSDRASHKPAPSRWRGRAPEGRVLAAPARIRTLLAQEAKTCQSKRRRSRSSTAAESRCAKARQHVAGLARTAARDAASVGGRAAQAVPMSG